MLGPQPAAARAGAYATTPAPDLGLALLDMLDGKPKEVAWVSVLVAMHLSEEDRALNWLELGYQERDGETLLSGAVPGFDPLRADARFHDLQRRIGLVSS